MIPLNLPKITLTSRSEDLKRTQSPLFYEAYNISVFQSFKLKLLIKMLIYIIIC